MMTLVAMMVLALLVVLGLIWQMQDRLEVAAKLDALTTRVARAESRADALGARAARAATSADAATARVEALEDSLAYSAARADAQMDCARQAWARTDAQVEFLSLAAVALLPIQSRGKTAEEGYAALLRRIGRMVEEMGPSAEAWLTAHDCEDCCEG